MAKKQSLIGPCGCDPKRAADESAETVLASGVLHTQFNCRTCGRSWATDAKAIPEGPTLTPAEPLVLSGGKDD